MDLKMLSKMKRLKGKKTITVVVLVIIAVGGYFLKLDQSKIDKASNAAEQFLEGESANVNSGSGEFSLNDLL